MAVDQLSSAQQRAQLQAYRYIGQRDFAYDGSATKAAQKAVQIELTPEAKLAASRIEQAAQIRAGQVDKGVMPLEDERRRYEEEMEGRRSSQSRARDRFLSGASGLLQGAVLPNNPSSLEPVRAEDGSVHPQSDKIKAYLRANMREYRTAMSEPRIPSFEEWQLARGVTSTVTAA